MRHRILPCGVGAALRALTACSALMVLAGAAPAQTSAPPSALSLFKLTREAGLPKYDQERLLTFNDAQGMPRTITPEACAAACTSDPRRNWCVSFDFDWRAAVCALKGYRAAEVGGLTSLPRQSWDHYALIEPEPEPLKDFAKTADAAISGNKVEPLTGVSPQGCAQACKDPSRSGWCKSFDFHKNDQRCDLSDKQAWDVGGLAKDYPGHPYDHYALIPGYGVPNPITGSNGRKHLLVIGLDGLRGDALFCNGCAVTPALSRLAQGGAWHRNVLAGGPQATLSGPGWSTLFTGYWKADHGVADNDLSRVLLKPHLFDVIKARYPTATVAVAADWLNLVSNLKPRQTDFLLHYEPKQSQQATDAVKGWLSWKNPPTAIFYYLHNTDIHEQAYEPLNAFYQSKIKGEDAQIQQVLDKLAARPTLAEEEWLIVVVSDHGGINGSHGGQTGAERDSLLILNSNHGNPAKPAYCRGDLTGTPLLQVDSLTPHALDFLGLPNTTIGRKHPACG